MRIISKHKDYYDYLGQIYGIDNKIVYYRKSFTADHINSFHRDDVYYPNEKNKLNVNVTLSRFFVWFCDKMYPAVEVSYTVEHKNQLGNPIQGYTDYSYTFYDFEELKSKWKNNINWKSWDEDNYEEHFKVQSNRKLNTEFNSPQIVTVSSNKIDIDVILKDYDFQKIMTPEQAFQKVSMFVGAKPDPPQQIPTDMHRFVAKGFDKKTSFRNM